MASVVKDPARRSGVRDFAFGFDIRGELVQTTRYRHVIGLVGVVICALPLITTAAQPTAQPATDRIIVIGKAVFATTSGVAERATAAANDACVDPDAYTLERWHIGSKRWEWFYNPAEAPASVGAGAVTALQLATQTMFTGTNRCGMRVLVSISQVYMGTTELTAQVGDGGICIGNDYVSVTSWGTWTRRRIVNRS